MPRSYWPLDTILATHGHFDHFADAAPLAWQTGAAVVANFDISTNLMVEGIENVTPMQKGGTAQAGGIPVTVVDASHASSIAPQRMGPSYTRASPAGT